MPTRLWWTLAVLCAAIAFGAGFALYVGAQEVRLYHAGPRRQIEAEEIDGNTRGWLLALGCARHDLEVAIDSDGQVVTGERELHDRIYFALTPRAECEEGTPPAALHIKALVESSDASSQGLSRLYGQGYQAPPTQVLVDGVIGFGAGDGRREYLARQALLKKGAAALLTVPLLVKDKRPGPPGIAYATAAVGLHGLLLLGFLGWMAVRRHLRRSRDPELPELDDDLGELRALKQERGVSE